MDSARAQGLGLIAKKFQKDLGIKVTIVTPQNITNDFPIAAQAGKGPDILIWAHDKVGEWAGAGLIAPVEVSNEFANKFFPKAWQAVRYEEEFWGYPIRSASAFAPRQSRASARFDPCLAPRQINLNAVWTSGGKLQREPGM